MKFEIVLLSNHYIRLLPATCCIAPLDCDWLVFATRESKGQSKDKEREKKILYHTFAKKDTHTL